MQLRGDGVAMAQDERAVEQERRKLSGLLDRAFQEFQRGDVRAAYDSWYRAHQLRPDDPYILTNLGLAADMLGRRDEAVNFTGRAAMLHRLSPALAVNHGFVLENAGQTARAMAEYRRALELDPAFEPALMAIGIWALAQNEAAEARRRFMEAARANPHSPDPHAGWAAAAARMELWEEAALQMQKAHGAAPQEALYAAAAGALFYRAGRADEAHEALDQALRLDPRQPDALVLRAELAWKRGDYLTAKEALDTAILIDHEGKDLAGSLLRRGELAVVLDRPDLARQALETALGQKGIAPEWSARAHTMMGAMALQRGDYAEALEAFRAAGELEEDFGVLAGMARARHYLALRKPVPERLDALHDVEGDYRKALAVGESAQVRVALGRLYVQIADLSHPAMRRGKFHQAEVQFQNALAAEPGMVEPHVRMGLLMERLNRFPEAKGHIGRAVELDPENERLRFLFAEMLRRQGERTDDAALLAEAQRQYREAMRINPEYEAPRLGWHLMAGVRPPEKPEKAPEDQGPEPEEPPVLEFVVPMDPEPYGHDSDEPVYPIDPPSRFAEEYEEIPPELEDLIPFLLPPEDWMGEEWEDPDVVPIFEDDRNPMYNIEGRPMQQRYLPWTH